MSNRRSEFCRPVKFLQNKIAYPSLYGPYFINFCWGKLKKEETIIKLFQKCREQEFKAWKKARLTGNSPTSETQIISYLHRTLDLIKRSHVSMVSWQLPNLNCALVYQIASWSNTPENTYPLLCSPVAAYYCLQGPDLAVSLLPQTWNKWMLDEHVSVEHDGVLR